ncbi:MAG: long-chain fatty acid--CoA ligase [Deltaproteobacteria bacterium]|nr:long-chain fatty acid--CoA ligase [Candidatus Zymogenaceae bacterium]
MTRETIVGLFLEQSASHPDDIIISYKSEPKGAYRDITWGDLLNESLSFAAGLLSLGFSPGERLAILSFNRLEWIIADLGTLLACGVDVPIYHTNTPEQCAYIIRDADVSCVVVEDAAQLDKILQKKGELPNLKHVILISDDQPPKEHDVILLSELMAKGKNELGTLKDEIITQAKNITADDTATIVYTSGTTGPPKGCLLSHRNTLYVLDSIHALIQIDNRVHRSLLILPLSHFYPRVSGYYYNLYQNIPLAIAESIDTLAADMALVRPTYFCSVPRVFEKVYARIVSAAEKGSPLKRALFRWAVSIGRKRSRTITAGRSPSVFLRLRYACASALVFKKIKNVLGGRLQFAVSAGAPLSAEVGEFIHSIGVVVIEFYGLTETVGGTMTTFSEFRYGTVGKAMPGFEVTLAPDGEILIRGNNFKGYHNRPELTEDVLKDGWCYTGDVGRWDDDGFLIITDRKKDLIITSGGKNISPQNIENRLKQIPLIANAIVIGDGRNYLTAILTLDPEEARQFAMGLGIPSDSSEEISRHPSVRDVIEKGVDSANADLARFETIKKFALLPNDFTQDKGEITPTLKLRRKVIRENYADIIESLYASSA